MIEDIYKFSKLFGSFAVPARLAIFLALVERPASPQVLSESLDMELPRVRACFRALRRAGLIEESPGIGRTRERGNWMVSRRVTVTDTEIRIDAFGMPVTFGRN